MRPAKQEPETNKKLLKWASIFKAETLEELEQLASGEEVFENMVVTMKKLSEYYVAAEPPVRRGESHLSGQTEPPCY